jgi:hypothetical protein
MARMRVCAQPECPTLSTQRRCPEHARGYEQQRGSRQARGYGREHDRLREWWRPRVELGGVRCARCDLHILIGQEWALDHNDDRTGYLGPSHKLCNDQAGGKAAHMRG